MTNEIICASDFKTQFAKKQITKNECSALISDIRYDELIKEVEQERAKVKKKKKKKNEDKVEKQKKDIK